MAEKQNLKRRDFLKAAGLSSLAMATLPAAKVLGQIGTDELVTSEDEYGGFYIRRHAIGDPPYKVDESVYKRFDAKNTVFGRMVWDKEVQEKMANTPGPEWGTKGFKQENSAFEMGAWVVANYDDSNAGLVGKHRGLFGLNVKRPMMIADHDWNRKPFDRSHMTDQDISQMVKKAAMFYGSSLVGIAKLDKKWIYSDSFGFTPDEKGKIEFFKAHKVEIPEGSSTLDQAKEIVLTEMNKKNPDEFKAFLIDVMSKMDPEMMGSDLPGDPVTMLNMMPAKKVKSMAPRVFETIPKDALKEFGKALGFDLTIIELDPSAYGKPHYNDEGNLQIPETMNRVVVMAFEMDYDTVMQYPNINGGAAAMHGYSRMATTSAALSMFIQELGYNAIPCGNMTGLSVPMAIDAGLGELGRQGILITPKYGPRVRLAKVITDLPMAVDRPISFGVKEFCDICMKCAKECPSQAILHGDQTEKSDNISNNPGVKKWPIDPVKCITGWTMSGNDCGVCIRTCPFNKIDGWLHEITRVLIGAKSGNLDKLMLKMDDASGFGEQTDPKEYWKGERFIHTGTYE